MLEQITEIISWNPNVAFLSLILAFVWVYADNKGDRWHVDFSRADSLGWLIFKFSVSYGVLSTLKYFLL